MPALTLNQFEDTVVLRLANIVPVQYWMHWNYPQQTPWLMAVKVYPTNQFQRANDWELFVENLAKRGLRWDERDRIFTVERVNSKGQPFTSLL